MAGHVTVAGIVPVGEEGRHELSLEAGPVEVAGELRDVLRLDVVGGDGVQREMRIPVRIRHRARVFAESSALVFPRAALQQRAEGAEVLASRTVVLSAEGDDVAFEVEGLALEGVPDGVVRASVEPIEAGRRYRVTVDCLTRCDSPLVQGKLVVLTNDPEVESIAIPLLAQFGKREGTDGAAGDR